MVDENREQEGALARKDSAGPVGRTPFSGAADQAANQSAPQPPASQSLFEFRDPISRRHFIRSVIVSGAVAAAGSIMPMPLVAGRADRTRVPGAVGRLLRLSVNGRKRPVEVLPNETLAMTLRYRLGLTGTKLGCDRGECGACTVLVDDVPLNSCSLLTHSVRARNVTTVEGLEGPNGELHPVQQAMIDELGPQCGFCTSGQIMAAVGLLKTTSSPTREEARQAMAGNLCRCGAYEHYLNAVMRAAQSSA